MCASVYVRTRTFHVHKCALEMAILLKPVTYDSTDHLQNNVK